MYEELITNLRNCAETNSLSRYKRDLMTQAADAIEELSMKLHGDEATIAGMKREIERMVVAGKPRWIPVTERLPEDRQSVLVHRDDGGIFIFEYFTTSPTDECWIDDHLNVYSAYSVTHWMPLPEPPKEET